MIRLRSIWGLVVLCWATAGCNAILDNKLYGVEGVDASTPRPEHDATTPVTLPEAGDDDATVDAEPADAGDGGSSDAAIPDGACASLDDPHTCGSCTNDCAQLTRVSDAGLGCASGQCSYACSPGYGDCADAGTGCATDFSSKSSCGGCAVACTGATPVCNALDAGAYGCATGCTAGQTNCDGTCATLATDQNHCGTCAIACPSYETCTGGTCQCPTAAAPNLCGTACTNEQTDSANCGSCGHACSGGQTCSAGACACPAGQTLCNGTCVNVLGTDVNNCGACGTVCAQLPHVSGTGLSCSAGKCAYTCAAGYGDCGNTGTGCSTALGTTTNCASCGAGCSGATSVCSASGATFACTNGCAAGQSNCSGTCSTLQSDGSNCGACGKACPAAETCQSGTCACPTTGNPNFCGSVCTNTNTDSQNCGSCAHACPSVQSCQAGACVCPNSTNPNLCGSTCTNTMTDTANCGTCGKTCGTGQQCVGGSCVCPSGTLNCSGTCESPTTGNSCGTSCTAACAGPTNGGSVGTAICTGSTCGISCNSGLSNCSNACVNEKTDTANCGACGHTCASGQTCSGGTCTCAGATHLCNGACVSNTDPNNCGTACNTNCPGPTSGSGSAVCAGNACGISCSSGTQCGTACVACPVGGVCSGNTCGCPAGQPTNCSNTCVDLTSNTTNCGRCGHSCFYGSCNATAGATGGPGCTSWTVATSPTTNAPNAIVSDGTNLIWADTGSTSIKEIAVSGQGAVKTLMQNSAFSTIPSASVFPMSLGGGKVAWVTTSNVWTVGVDGSSPRMESFTVPPPSGQTLQNLLNLGINSNATWIGVMVESTSLAFELDECPVGGAASSCKMVSQLSFIPVGAASNSTNYYFHDNNTGSIGVMTFGVTPNLGTLESGQGSGMTGGTAIDSNFVYWTGDSYGIKRANQIGGAVSNVTTFPSGTGVVIATDGTNVYFTTNGSPNFVGYAPVGGGSGPFRIAPSTSATGIVAAGGMVFWLDGSTIYGIGAP